MAPKFSCPVRMCILCRSRHPQKDIIRLQCRRGRLVSFSMEGRSFYICYECLNSSKKIVKSLMRRCQGDSNTKDQITIFLEEIRTNG